MSYKIKKYQVDRRRVPRLTLGAVLTALFVVSCSKSEIASELKIAEDFLWNNPEMCISYIDGLDYSKMTEHDSCVCALEREHAKFKVEYGLENDSTVMALKDYFETQGDHRYAGEACYIIGRDLVIKQSLPMATFYQKAAEEHLLKADQVPNQLLGMVYYGLGRSAEYERLFEVANEYFQKSLPFFLASGDSLYISCAYRDIAKSNVGSADYSLMLFDSAAQYLPSVASAALRIEIEKSRLNCFLLVDSTEYIRIYHKLCDSLHIYQHATELCQYYLENDKLDSARYYLELSEPDTAKSTWNKEHFLYNKACYLSEIGKKDSAISVLKALHLWQTEEIEASAHTRAYMVEQRYDAERERADRIEAEAGKRRAHLIILIGAASATLLIVVLLLLLKQERMKKQQKAEQLQHKQHLLQEQLKMRLNVSAELKKQRSTGRRFTEETYNQILSSVVFLNPSHWETLMKEFDFAYAGLMTNLSSHYKLTDVDRLYVVLIILGCSNEDISELVNVSIQSVKNRKILLKQHLNTEDSLEKFLMREVDACKRNYLSE